MGLFDRLTKFRVDGQMMLSTKVLSTVILMSVEIESVGNFFQMLSSFVGFLCSGCVVGSEGDSFYGGEELILFAFFVAFMEFIDDLDEPGLEFFHIVFDPIRRVGFVWPADFTDHDDGIGIGIVIEHLHDVDVL